MSLLKQLHAAESKQLTQRIGAAMLRHAVFLTSKETPTNAETAWQKAVLGNQFDSMLARAVRYYAAKPALYEAADITVVTDDTLLSIAADLPAALPPLS